jgi:hypothetical protein
MEAISVVAWSKNLTRCVLGVGLCAAFVFVCHAQPSTTPAPRQQSRPATPADEAAQREKIWNSPNMLRARAWLHDYCSKSARITPEMAKKYQEELANMTPTQMELWLLKFDHAEEQRQQQYAAFQAANQAGMQRAMAANRAAQQSLSDFNQEQSQAAGEEQQRLNEQAEFRQNMIQENMPEPMGPYYPYPVGAGLYGGYGGGLHFHYHY